MLLLSAALDDESGARGFDDLGKRFVRQGEGRGGGDDLVIWKGREIGHECVGNTLSKFIRGVVAGQVLKGEDGDYRNALVRLNRLPLPRPIPGRSAAQGDQYHR
jgi:hypothetical protein